MKKSVLLLFLTLTPTLKPMVQSILEENQHTQLLEQDEFIDLLKKEGYELAQQNQSLQSHEKFSAAAQLGDKEAQYILAVTYLRSNSKSDSIRLLSLAAEQNYLPAKLALIDLTGSKLLSGFHDADFSESQQTTSSAQSSESSADADDDVDDKILTIEMPEGAQVVHTSAMGACADEPGDQKVSYEKEKRLFKQNAELGDARSQYMLGSYFEEEGDTKEALRWYKLAVARDNSSAKHALARIYEKEGNFEELKRLIKPFAERGDTTDQIYLAWILHREKKFEEAYQWCKRAADKDCDAAQSLLPTFASSLVSAGKQYELDGKVQDAKRAYTIAAEFGEIEAQDNLAELHLKEGNFEEVERYCQLLASQEYKRSQNYIDLFSYSILKAAQKLLDAEELAGATRLYRLAATLGCAIAQCRLGEIHKKAGNAAEAKQFFQLSAAKNHWEAQRALAEIYKAENNLDEAQRAYQAIFDQSPHYFAKSDLYGIYELQINRYEEEDNSQGLQQLRELLQQPAERGDVDAQFLLGRTYKAEGKILEAQQWYKRSVASGSQRAHLELTWLYSDQFNWAALRELYESDAMQGTASAQRMLGIAYQKEGNNEQARHWLKRSADQGDHSAQESLATIYEEEGKLEEAAYFYKLSSAGFPHCNINVSFLACAVCRQGRKKEEEGNPQEAKRLYRFAADLGDHEAQKKVADFCVLDGTVEEVLEIYSPKAGQGDISAQMLVARIFVKQGKTNEAIMLYKTLTDKEFFALDELAELYKSHGMVEELKNLYRYAAERDSFYEYHLGTVYRDEGDREAIEQLYERGGQHVKGYFPCWIAMLYEKEDNHEEALRWLRRAADEGHEDAQKYFAQIVQE